MVKPVIMSMAFYFVIILYSHGQDLSRDTSDETIIWHDNLIGRSNSGLINGPEYKVEYMGKNTHPFFEERTPNLGMVYYRGHTYLDVPLIYDIHHDKLVLVHQTEQQLQFLVELVLSEVEEFSIWGHNFKKMTITDSLEALVSTGYFEVIWDEGEYDLIAKRRKVNFPQGQDIRFFQANMFFLKRDQEVIQVRAKRHFLKVFPERKSDIKRFLKKNKLRIKNKDEAAMIQLVKYCNSLYGEEVTTK